MHTSRFHLLALLLSLLLLFVPGCDDAGVVSYDPVSGSAIEVDPVFREFYDSKGGAAALGPAISPVFTFNSVYYQYLVTGLMYYDSQSPASQRRGFAPLGLDMGIYEPAVQQSERPGTRYLNGHLIDERFVAVYDQLGGQPVAGLPLTEAHYNPDYRRFEQYFENLGLFISDMDPEGQVRLLAYGAWKCDASCREVLPGGAAVSIPFRIDPRFADAVNRLGADFTGYALTDTYITPDSFTEQVFENVVLVSDPNQGGRVFLRAVTEALGILPDPMVAPNNLPEVYFFPRLNGTLGYNIPKYYLDYIAQHGGQESSGPPISENVLRRDNIFRQCFVNLCLEEHTEANGARLVRPAQLGFIYKDLAVRPLSTPAPQPEALPTQPVQPTQPGVQQAEPAVQPPAQPSTSDPGQGGQPSAGVLLLQLWESYPMVAPKQNQEIGVLVLQDNAPLRGVEPDLIVTLPDGRSKQYFMYPTGEDGLTQMTIDPIDAPPGTVISYQVCIVSPGGAKTCVQESFLIWINP